MQQIEENTKKTFKTEKKKKWKRNSNLIGMKKNNEKLWMVKKNNEQEKLTLKGDIKWSDY